MNKRTLVFTSFIFSILCLATSLVGYFGFVKVSEDNVQTTLKSYMNLSTTIFDGSNTQTLDSYLKKANGDSRLTIFSDDKILIYDSYGESNIDFYSFEEFSDLGNIYHHYSEYNHQEMYYICKIDNSTYLRIGIPGFQFYTTNAIFITLDVIFSCAALSLMFVLLYFERKREIKSLKEEMAKLNKIVKNNEVFEQNYKNFDDVIYQMKDIRISIDKRIRELILEKEKNKFIINNISQGLIILDQKKKVILINKIALSIFGIEESKIINASFLYLFSGVDFISKISEAYKSKIDITDKIKIKDRTYLLNIGRINYHNMKEFNLSILLIDITNLNQIELMKKDFFDNASHELKSPLTSIIGNLQLISGGLISDKSEEESTILTCINEAKRMNKIISDMLELSYLETTENSVTESIDVSSILKDSITSFVSLAALRNIKISANISSCVLKIKAQDFKFLVDNLIDNAIKYNKDNGSINVVLTQNYFEIKDTGIGIEDNEIPRIFERFYRVDKSRSKRSGGTGLGLSIVKHIVNNYQYKIFVSSSINEGTTFTITFKD